jgi:diacylglycerol kinase
LARELGRRKNLLKRIFEKFRVAVVGIKIAISTDNSFKTHIVFMLLSILLGFYLALNPLEWALLIFANGLVFVAELFNTAIEYLVRMFTQKYHELAEKLLDVSAGAVLFAAIVAIIIGIILFGPKILGLFAPTP